MDEKPKTQQLTEAEAAMLASINQNALNVKARLYDIQRQREQAERELEALQRHFDAAIASLGASHEIANATVTPDFRHLISRGA